MTDRCQKRTNKDNNCQKFFYSICMCITYLLCGWILGQTSTALLDLQKITSVTLDQSSLYLTFLGIGFISGSFTYGVVCNYVDKLMIQFLALTLAAISIAAIPWCHIHVAMVTAHAIVGFCNGILDSVVNSEMLAVWGNGGRRFMQAIYLSNSIGGIVASLVTAMFVSPMKPDKQLMFDDSTFSYKTNFTAVNDSQHDAHAIRINTGGLDSINITEDLQIPKPFYLRSQLFYAYIISSCLIITVAVLYLTMFFSFNRDIYSDRVSAEVTSSQDISIFRKLIILLNMGLMAGVYTAIEESFSGFLPAFSTTQLNWSKSYASYVLCVFYSCIGLGRLFAVFWVRYLNPKKILVILCLSVSIALSSMLWCGQHYLIISIWVSVAFMGFFLAAILPTVFTWTEEDFFPVTGHISSYFNIAADCGATINPVIIGTLMEHRSPMWFVYVLLIESSVLLMTNAIGILLSRKHKTMKNKYQEME